MSVDVIDDLVIATADADAVGQELEVIVDADTGIWVSVLNGRVSEVQISREDWLELVKEVANLLAVDDETGVGDEPDEARDAMLEYRVVVHVPSGFVIGSSDAGQIAVDTPGIGERLVLSLRRAGFPAHLEARRMAAGWGTLSIEEGENGD